MSSDSPAPGPAASVPHGRSAAVIGSGPNGLAAAVHLARNGVHVTVYEAADTPGGAARSAAALGPGTVVDLGSAGHPFGVSSPFFRSLALERHGLEWVQPEYPAAHPLDGRPAALLQRSLNDTAVELGEDAAMWKRIMGQPTRQWDKVVNSFFGPLLRVPRHPVVLARFGLRAVLPATVLTRAAFTGDAAKALFAGCAAHSFIPLHHPLTSAFGVLFSAAGHTRGWPVAKGGSVAITNALIAELEAHGGSVVTGHHVEDARELGNPDLLMFDTGPQAALSILGDRVPSSAARSLKRWKYGAAAYKVDYLLDGPIPWADPRVEGAGTVHLGGTVEELAHAEAQVGKGKIPDQPFVLLCQQSMADAGRAPAGQQIVYAYAHVPNGAEGGHIGRRIDAQIERFAPGFRDRVLERVETGATAFEAANPNLVGGDIIGGSVVGTQVVLRPRATTKPYSLGAPGAFICSASTPPGGGVHGMCGYHAAEAALASLR